MGLSKLTIVDTKQSQNFTSSEKAQARANIGAVSYEDLSNISPMTELTYADLVATRNGGKLVPGMNYKITDYTTTTTQQDTMAAGHDFCVIVQALDEHTLSENAKACRQQFSGDISDLSSITLKALIIGDDFNGDYEIDEGAGLYVYYDKYTIDGTEYHRWMKYTNEGGKWMPIGDNNRGLSYALTLTDTFDLSEGYAEFDGGISIDQETGDVGDYEIEKVIMDVTQITVPLILFENKFNPEDGYEDAPEVYDMGQFWVYNGTWDLDGTTYYKWIKYNSYEAIQGEDYDVFYMLTTTKNYRNNSGKQEPDGFVYVDSGGELENRDGNYRAEVILGTNYESFFYSTSGGSDSYFDNCNIEAWELKYCLDNDNERFHWADEYGKGVIYYMKDEWNNECPYDFKNIMFKRWLITAHDIVEDLVGTYGGILSEGPGGCAHNIPDIDNDAEIDADDWKWRYTFDTGNSSDSTMNAEYDINNNKIEQFAGYPVFGECADGGYGGYNIAVLNNIVFCGEYCYGNSFGANCRHMTFGERCYNNTFECDCRYNSIGNNIYYNSIGNYFTDNSIGNNFQYNSIGNDFYSNSIGSDFYRNSIGNSFGSNSIGNYFYYNSIGSDFYSNSIGNSFYRNSIGSYIHHNSIGNEVYNNSIGNGFNNNSIGNGFHDNSIGNYFTDNSIGNNVYYNSIGNNVYYNSIGSYTRYCTINEGVMYIDLIGGTSTSDYVQNCHIYNGTQGVSESNKLVISFEKDKKYVQFAALNGDNNLVIRTF